MCYVEDNIFDVCYRSMLVDVPLCPTVIFLDNKKTRRIQTWMRMIDRAVELLATTFVPRLVVEEQMKCCCCLAVPDERR